MSDNDSWDPDAGDANEGPGGTNNNIKEENDVYEYDDDRIQLRSFYEEASMHKMASIRRPSPPPSSQNLSQEALLSQQSSANLSLAEMSRMEETLLSQTSHHEEEEERQRQKLEKRERRNKGIKAKKPRRPPTEIQIKNQKEYQRFKYKKGTDMSKEQDVGGSMEYLMREKLGQQAEQRRLRAVARGRERKRRMKEANLSFFDDGEDKQDETTTAEDIADGPSKNDHGANWNFLDEGYVTMPRADAEKLPYYVFRNSKRKLGSIQGGEKLASSNKASSDVNDGDGSGSGGRGRKRRRKTRGGHLMFLEKNTTASDTDTSCRSGGLKNSTSNFTTLLKKQVNNKSQKSERSKCTFSIDEPDNVTRSFPLCFHQLKRRMDLHGMIDTTTLGSERMVVAHGRNVKRLWTRMVASSGGGLVMNNNHDGSCSHDAEKNDNKRSKVMKKEDDSIISNVSFSSSSSSKSSVHSYQPTEVYSQIPYGTTSVICMENPDGMNSDSKRSKQNPLLRLMSMVHTLPKITHRHHFLMKVAQELGTNRRLWEDELRYWMEVVTGGSIGEHINENSVVECQRRVNPTPAESWAIKSFLGVHGSVSPPPYWASDPSMPTHPTLLKQRMHSLRSSLTRRFRRRIGRDQTNAGATMPISGDVVGIIEDGTKNADLKGNEDASGASAKNQGVENLARNEDVKGEASDDGTEWSATKLESAYSKIEDSSNFNEDPQNVEEVDEIYPNETRMDPSHAAVVGESAKPFGSLMDEIQKDTDPEGGADKYAKVIHESNIDISNIIVALSSFIEELNLSKTRLRQKQQQIDDSTHLQRRHALRLAQEDIGYWHESIASYLALAETLAKPRDANFYKSGNVFPENASLAQAVMATQSYFANGGGCGVGCGRKMTDLQPSLWEMKDENHSSDDSDVSDPGNAELGTTISNRKTSSKSLEKKDLRGIQLTAKDIARRGRDSLANKHLTSFAPIHLTTGIAIIAAILTPHAAELVSRPCHPDASENRTPFDLIRNMLTMIEEDGSLISPPRLSWDSKGKIIDEMLVGTMREAAMVFQKSLKKDPKNVDHWSWYVSALLGMLCTAFGTFPSGIPKNVGAGCEQTERCQLESFRKIRSNASIAVTDFIKFSQNLGCPMFHLAISSMLEWKRAIFLMHRPLSFSDTNIEYTEVKRLHAYHSYHWAVKVCSNTSIAKVQQLCESKHLPRDALLDILACAIEHNPCERKNWTQFVKALGRVRPSRKCDTSCLHTKQLHSEEGQGWWGKHRLAEWEDQFFHSPKSATKAVKPEFVHMVSAVVEPHCQNNVPHMEEISLKGEEISIHDPKACMGWIWNPSDDIHGMDYDHDVSMKDVLLPTNTSNFAINSQSDLLLDSKIQQGLSGNPSCDALCMKILVACHLMGAWHPFVCHSTWWLSVKLWQSVQAPGQHQPGTRNCYGDGLAWLSIHGLDLLVYLQCRLKHSLDDSSNSTLFIKSSI